MNKVKSYVVVALSYLLVLVFQTSCQTNEKKNQEKNQNQNQKEVEMEHVDWSKNANIYEVNIRQYTEEGTINAFRKHLPRLNEMGVDILWLMPVQPIGELNRKGSLGSYYSVKDYKAVNPEFGTMQDMKNLVKEAHDMGMYVILDWVANHSSWDNTWATEHPEYYVKNDDGTFHSPYDWTDVIQLDYNNPAVRDSMTRALKFWIEETNIDGYRCDVAGMVPTDFWNDAVAQLKQIKPVFMLAEDEDNLSLLEYAFDMNYTWKLLHLMNDMAKGEKNVKDMWAYINRNNQTYSPEDYRMNFITNHDENSWNGTVKERMGDAAKAFAVLTYTIPGMPLVYSGQEAGNEKALRFFEKDTIDWSQIPYQDFYTTLNRLKEQNKALWNGTAGGTMIDISAPGNDNLFAILREKDKNKVVVVINFSVEESVFLANSMAAFGTYKDVFKNESVKISEYTQLSMKPWSYLLLTNQE
jgi:glycosidase